MSARAVSADVASPGSPIERPAPHPVPLIVPLVTLVLYVIVTVVSAPVFVADTPDMAISAVGWSLGQNCTFLEPGHLLWRPVGYAMLETFNTVRPGVETDAILRASQVQLGWFAWVSGLVAIVIMAVWVQERVGRLGATAFGVAAVLLSKAFVNYSQVGSSYMPALACLVVGLYMLSRGDLRSWTAMIAGALLGASVLFWGTFVLALPAALLAPLLFSNDRARAMRVSAFAIAGGAATALLAAVLVSMTLDLQSPSQLAAWASTADHGISVGGVPRAVLGFARSYLETGDYGKVVKRFLIGSPDDPVSVRELLGFPFIGIAGFYLGLLVALVLAVRSKPGRTSFWFFVANAIPVVLFAVVWQGGDLERYMPLMPGVALLLAAAFAAAPRPGRVVLAGWLVILVIPNAITLGTPAVRAAREQVHASLRPVESPGRAPLLVFSHWQDERVQFRRNYPPHAEPLPFRFYHLLTPGTSSVIDWRRRAAARILQAFNGGVDVFVSERLLTERPRREWFWVDGDDARVSWSDFHAFFSPLEYGAVVGSPGDGFAPLLPTAKNREALEGYRAAVQQASGEAAGQASPGAVRACSLPLMIPAANAPANPGTG